MDKLVIFHKEVDLGGGWYVKATIFSSLDEDNNLIEDIRVDLKEDGITIYTYRTKASCSYEDRYVKAVKNAVSEWKTRQFNNASEKLDSWDGVINLFECNKIGSDGKGRPIYEQTFKSN